MRTACSSSRSRHSSSWRQSRSVSQAGLQTCRNWTSSRAVSTGRTHSCLVAAHRRRTSTRHSCSGVRIALGLLLRGNVGSEQYDEIAHVLRECEVTLRTLAEQRRLTTGALDAFVQLSAAVRQQMERRRAEDRRAASRPGHVDRRASHSSLGPDSGSSGRSSPPGQRLHHP